MVSSPPLVVNVFDELVIELIEFAVLAGIDGVIDNSAGSQELVEVDAGVVEVVEEVP
jgi:hypothetical protein